MISFVSSSVDPSSDPSSEKFEKNESFYFSIFNYFIKKIYYINNLYNRILFSIFVILIEQTFSSSLFQYNDLAKPNDVILLFMGAKSHTRS